MQDAIVIEKLGGATKVSKDISTIAPIPVNPKAVQAWQLRDRIPGEWRPWVARLAAAALPGFSTEEFLLAATHRTYTRKADAA